MHFATDETHGRMLSAKTAVDTAVGVCGRTSKMSKMMSKMELLTRGRSPTLDT